MSEKPSWLKGVHEGGKGLAQEELTQDDVMELATIRQVFLDEAPEDDWQSQIDAERLQEYRTQILSWSKKELLKFCREHYAWDGDPTFTKALIDVIGGITERPIT